MISLEKARNLAEIEKKIYQMSGNPSINRQQKTESSTNSLFSIIVPAVIAAAAFVASQYVNSDGFERIGCWIVVILALGKTYMNWKQQSFIKNNEENSKAAGNVLAGLMQQRSDLISELNKMKSSDDKKKYWWETGVMPSERSKWTPKLDLSEWKFGVFDEIKIVPKKDGLYCEDFVNEMTICSRKQAEKLCKSSDFCEIYRDNNAWSSKNNQFVSRYLYAYSMDQLEEITSHTTRVRIDKEGEMKKYQNKLDEWERISNWEELGTFDTNRELYDYDKISRKTYQNRSYDRNWMEYWKQDEINKMPDYEENTVYRQKFDNFYDMVFLPCAMILWEVKGDSVGRIASVFISRKIQNSIEFTMRAEVRECPSCGYLESYLESEPLIIGGTRIKPDIKMVADYLFEKQTDYKFCKRDILEPKPNGLTDEEWCYLIWMDH